MPRVVVQSGLIMGPFPVTLLRDGQPRRQPRVTGTVRTAPAGKAQTPGLKGCEGRWGFCESHARPGAAADAGSVPGPPRAARIHAPPASDAAHTWPTSGGSPHPPVSRLLFATCFPSLLAEPLLALGNCGKVPGHSRKCPRACSVLPPQLGARGCHTAADLHCEAAGRWP